MANNDDTVIRTRTANEDDTVISSAIADDTGFVLVSDGCTYQNRNRILSTSLSNLVKDPDITIEQPYLVRERPCIC